jgi:hypothetical protein
LGPSKLELDKANAAPQWFRPTFVYGRCARISPISFHSRGFLFSLGVSLKAAGTASELSNRDASLPIYRHSTA